MGGERDWNSGGRTRSFFFLRSPSYLLFFYFLCLYFTFFFLFFHTVPTGLVRSPSGPAWGSASFTVASPTCGSLNPVGFNPRGKGRRNHTNVHENRS